MRRLLNLVLLGGLALGLTACAGYKLGPTNGLRAGEKSIQVNPVQNATLEPRLGEAVSHALRKQIQRDGTYRLETGTPGDVVVSANITRYARKELAYQTRDTLTARDYEVTLHAKVVAIDRVTGREILNRDVKGRTTVRIGTDLTSAERQALPLLAEDLARNITSLLVDGEW